MSATAANLLASARSTAGLSQTELGRRTGMQQSAISAYESGRRDPGHATFSRLVDAMGFEIQLVPISRLNQIRRVAPQLNAALADLGATNVRVFGSVARGDDGPSSDIDLLVDIAPGTGLFALGGMQEVAEGILGRPVDIVPASGLRDSIADEVRREAIAL